MNLPTFEAARLNGFYSIVHSSVLRYVVTVVILAGYIWFVVLNLLCWCNNMACNNRNNNNLIYNAHSVDEI